MINVDSRVQLLDFLHQSINEYREQQWRQYTSLSNSTSNIEEFTVLIVHFYIAVSVWFGFGSSPTFKVKDGTYPLKFSLRAFCSSSLFGALKAFMHEKKYIYIIFIYYLIYFIYSFIYILLYFIYFYIFFIFHHAYSYIQSIYFIFLSVPLSPIQSIIICFLFIV